MKNAIKFTFDTDFDTGGADPHDPRARKAYTLDEIETIKREAREEGRRDGDVRATQAVAASISQVAAAVLSAIQAMDAEIEVIRSEAAALAVAAAKNLAGKALSLNPEAEIDEVLQAALHQAVGEPRVVVRTSPVLADRIQERANEIAAQEGYEGRMQFVADGALRNADCRIEWRGGGIERSQATIEQALDHLVSRRFSHTMVEENA